MKSLKFICGSMAVGSFMLIPGLESSSRADSVVVVNPSNMGGWALNSFDDNGNIVTSGPFLGTAQMTTGPATPPYGVGSAHIATPPPSAAPDPSSPGAGGAAAIGADTLFNGTLLTTITSLSYWAYMSNNGPVNNQQFPYLAITINTGAIDNTSDAGASANTLDTLFFEPPYQQPSTGNSSLPNQGPTTLATWQKWNALEGGWWDNDGIGNPGTPEGPTPGVEPLSVWEADYPDASIAYGGLPGLGGVALQVGFADSTSQFDGNVDGFTMGVAGVNTTYDFEPNVPEPSCAALALVGAGAGLLRRRRRKEIVG